MTLSFEMYTDGACKGNPGVGGYCAILLAWRESESGERQLAREPRYIVGGEDHTTNNIMELRAVIEGLRSLSREDVELTIYIDSQYVRQGITEWIQNWKKNGWLTRSKEPVKNADLWRELDQLVSMHRIRWQWTKGHADDEWNNAADQRASDEALRRLKKRR
jgi:ribonuclease HI